MRWLVLMMLLVVASGCRKKSAPEFYRLEGDVTVLEAREGDDAWESPEMAEVERALSAIPADVIEAPKVQGLLAKVRAERARVVAEREARRPRPSEPTRFERPDEPGATTDEPGTEAEDDAGAPRDPVLGMSEADFLAAFGGCFKSGPAVDVPDAGRGPSHVVLARPDCEGRFGEKGSTVSYVFSDGKLSGRRFEGPPSIEFHDAGSPPPRVLPPPATPFDAGQMISFPGAPRPENMEAVPGSPGSNPPP